MTDNDVKFNAFINRYIKISQATNPEAEKTLMIVHLYNQDTA